jgi:hypothetical protein
VIARIALVAGLLTICWLLHRIGKALAAREQLERLRRAHDL